MKIMNKIIPLILIVCLLLPSEYANASTIKQELNSDGIKTYYVSTEKEHGFVINLIKYKMETTVNIVYSKEMVPKSKKNLEAYYMSEALDSINLYYDNVSSSSYQVAKYKGFGLKSAIYNKTKKTVTVTYEFHYYETLDQARYSSRKINKAIKENISSLTSDYQKAKWAYEWVIDNVQCDFTEENTSVYSGFTNVGTVCGGYATIYYLVATKLGLDCRYIEGKVRESSINNHAWNLIKLDGEWYCVDSIWGDNYDKDKFFLKSINTFSSKEYGYHNSIAYENYINEEEVFSDTDYIVNE